MGPIMKYHLSGDAKKTTSLIFFYFYQHCSTNHPKKWTNKAAKYWNSGNSCIWGCWNNI